MVAEGVPLVWIIRTRSSYRGLAAEGVGMRVCDGGRRSDIEKVYLRPNLLHMEKLVLILLFLLLLARRSDGPAGAHATVDVLLFLFRWLQDLQKQKLLAWEMTLPQKYTHLERAQETLIDTHHGTRVVEFTTVVRRAEQRHQLALREELVPILHNLVRTAYQVHVVFLQEARHHVRAKGERDATVVFAPAGDVLVRIRPQEIAQKSAVGDLFESTIAFRRGE